MSEPVIRPAAPADAPAMATLGLRTFLHTFVEDFAIPYPAHDLDPFVAKHFSEAAFAAEIADSETGVWVAEGEDGSLLGYATAGKCALPHPDASAADGELKRLYLDRPAQGSGLAPRLMETVLTWLAARDGGPLWLGVWSGNLRAQRFYARYGFVKAGEYDYRVGASVDHEFILRRG
ncbi:N-acetyltransferase [soil metagenome]